VRNLKSRRGFSIAEVIIALVVIVIVMISALSIMLSSLSMRTKNLHRTEVQDFADAVKESFVVAEDDADFRATVLFATGVTLSEGTVDADGAIHYAHVFETSEYLVLVAVSFAPDTRPELHVTATDQNAKTLFTFSFRKGEGL